MSRGDWLRPLSVVGVFSFALGGAAHAVQRPNLLFIMTDQQRWDALSIAGNEVLETPNLDRIGKAHGPGLSAQYRASTWMKTARN